MLGGYWQQQLQEPISEFWGVMIPFSNDWKPGMKIAKKARRCKGKGKKNPRKKPQKGAKKATADSNNKKEAENELDKA